MNDSQANIFQLVGYNHPNLAYIQSFWSQLTGTESKMELVDGLRNEIIATANIGWEVWSSFILKEVGILGLVSSLECICKSI